MQAMTVEQYAASIRTLGFCVLTDAIPPDLVREARERLIALLEEDERRLGRAFLEDRREWGRTRLLPNRGRAFIDLLELPRVHGVIEHLLGDYRVLYYNGTSLLPHQGEGRGGQLSWHTDLDLCTGEPLWINVFYLLEDFSEENGGTLVIPGSQQRPMPRPLPDDLRIAMEATATRFVAPVGSVILFDSTIWHAAGINTTDRPRLMVAAVDGQMRPGRMFRPQFDFQRALDAAVVDGLSPVARRILGLDDRPVPGSMDEYFAGLPVR